MSRATTHPVTTREEAKLAKKVERARLLECARTSVDLIARRVLPYGRIRNHYWISRDPQRPADASASLSVNLLDGSWRNFRDGTGGDDVVSLLVHIGGMEPEEAETALRKMLEPCSKVHTNEA